MSILTNKPGRPNREIPLDDLPNQARRLRLERDLSLYYLADKIGCKHASIREFEMTGKGLGDDLQRALAHALGVDPGTLLSPGKKFWDRIRKSLDNIR